MTRLYMLDTNTVSSILKGKSAAARKRLAGLREGEVACLSSITEAELLYGVANSGGEQRRRSLEWFLTRMKVMPWGRNEAAAYGTIRARQEQLGKPLGPLDTQIAAHAVALGAIVVTNDKAFRQVEALSVVESWAIDIA